MGWSDIKITTLMEQITVGKGEQNQQLTCRLMESLYFQDNPETTLSLFVAIKMHGIFIR